MKRAIITLATAILLAACGLFPSGKSYPLAIRDVRQTLLATQPPMEFFPAEAASALVKRESDTRISWFLVDRQGSGLLTFVAELTEVGPQETRIAITIEPPAGGRHDQVAKGLEENPTVVDFYRSAMAEQLGSKLEKRDFDMAAIQGKMMMAAFATMPKMQENLDKAVEQEHARNRENIDKAYREEAQGSPAYRREDPYSSREPAYGEPMDPATGSAW
ncbi:hypothetical protein SZ64_13145 [Erythrobacter sp. SG61-1L]|uniref:hypothetical protein n=1 Tax=Erythrobacter sp. SG61-1L TaxID=1603897 RepID=UPI0006C91675|nr:hypothetical protein [Erythrobacter sp. SG61-1L]KPL68962.1 hypothetical protein SZ64_13145 [Erythrobacter sp. SG61-1L]